MKPTTIAELMKRAREAGHDSLGLANDLEATMALASVQRNTFLRDRSERALRRWHELVAEVAASSLPEDRALVRWLAIEHLRLTAALKRVPLADVILDANAARWCAKLDVNERAEVTRHFELDMAAPLKAASVGSRD